MGWTGIITDNVLHFAAVRCDCFSSYKCTCKCIMEQRYINYKETRWTLLHSALLLLLLVQANNNSNNMNYTHYSCHYLWCCHRCESSAGSSNSTKCLLINRPSKQTWSVSLPVRCCFLCSLLPFCIAQPRKKITHLTIPRQVEGWVDLGTAVRTFSLCRRLSITVVSCDIHTDCPCWDLILSSHVLQSGILPPDRCNINSE